MAEVRFDVVRFSEVSCGKTSAGRALMAEVWFESVRFDRVAVGRGLDADW